VKRRRLIAGCAAAAVGPAFAISAARAAERFPQRPVVLWVPWPPGGGTDLTLRVLVDLAAKPLGQKIVVENRGGAGGTLAMPVLQNSAPDGYTIAQMPQTVFRAPLLQKLTWDPIRDTTPIIQVSGVTFGLVVAATGPLRSVDDLLNWGRMNPGELTIATNGVGTTPHLVLDDLLARRRVSWVHVPYKGVAEQMIAVASGQVIAAVGANGFAPLLESGALRLLATFGAQRAKRWPQVPTMRELGFGIVATSPYGIAGPRGMAANVVQTLHDAFKIAMFDPLHIAELERYDQELAYLGPEDYGQAMREAYAAEKRSVARSGVARGS
jgi:tripartite-type tricarboxylate transporter receptor subunit TctC